MYSGNQAAKGQAAQASAMSNAENDAIAKQNMSQMVRNSYRTGMLNVQLGLQKKQAVQQGFDTSVQFRNVMGQAVSNKEAASAIGGSADAVVTDLEMQYENSKMVQQENFASILDNYNNELDAMRMNAQNQVVDAKKYEYHGPSSGQIVGGALVGAATSAAGNYAMRNMSLGLGPRAGKQVQSTTGTMAGFRQDPFGPTQSRFNF
jgi:hypothetical protein